MKNIFKNINQTVSGSFGQIYFAENTSFSLLLLLASFINWQIGLSGIISVLFATLLSRLLELNSVLLKNGTYTFNVLLTGLALGANFQFNGAFLITLLLGSIISLFLSAWFNNLFTKHQLPFLSLPFVISVWILFLNARVFQSNLFLEKNSFIAASELCQFNLQISNYFETNVFSNFVSIYFKSMSSVLFQSGILPGLLISLGLLIHSRIAFLLSWLGYTCGYFYFLFSHGEALENEYINQSFNYIFSAIALGGFFLIPSIGSFLLVILSTPVIGLFQTALIKFTAPYYLPVFSLPYSLVVIIVASILNNRLTFKHLQLVVYQFYSPEKNFYVHHSHKERFAKNTLVHLHLPFFGEWKVSQGYNGKITHKDDWQYALDFVVVDKEDKSYKLPGKYLTDFYCFGLPILAPADGEITCVEDGVEDNVIGENNLEKNWGNTIIIKHDEYLYSKLSHLKMNSIKVKLGDRVKKGDIIAQCGSSGRSPEPHLHFQVQNNNYIDGKSIQYPLSYFLSHAENGVEINSFNIPNEKDIISRPIINHSLVRAFNFSPGMKIRFTIDNDPTINEWEVSTNAFNVLYISCSKTNSYAYFNNNENIFYFTDFEGDTNSLLYHFYLAAYKVSLSTTNNLTIKDTLPIHLIKPPILKFLQDSIAPFFLFLKPSYTSQSTESSSNQTLNVYSIVNWLNKKNSESINYEIEIDKENITELKIQHHQKCQILHFVK